MNTQIRSGFTLTKTALIGITCIMLSCNKDDNVNTEDGAEMELNFQFVKRGAAYDNSISVSCIGTDEAVPHEINGDVTGIDHYPCVGTILVPGKVV